MSESCPTLKKKFHAVVMRTVGQLYFELNKTLCDQARTTEVLLRFGLLIINFIPSAKLFSQRFAASILARSVQLIGRYYFQLELFDNTQLFDYLLTNIILHISLRYIGIFKTQTNL